MSLSGVKGAIKLGGLAMPSMAVRKVSQGNINEFGDIVFVGNSKLVEPSRTTEIYNRDAWTPSIAQQMRYNLNKDGVNFIKKIIDEKGDKDAKGQGYSTFLYNILESIDTPRSNNMAMELYAFDKGLDYYDINPYDSNYLKWYDENIFSNAEPYLWTENATNTDMVAKKFTLENILKILKKQEKSAGGYIGDYVRPQMLLQFFAKKFKNLDEVRKNKDRLATHAEHRKAVEDISTEFYHLASELEKEDETYDYFSNEMGVALATLEESDNAIKEKLTRYKLDNSDEAVNKIKGLQQMLKDVVTDYFEAKPRRIVRLNEFSGVIVPVGKQYDEVADTLAQQFGLKVERYDDSQQYNTALNNIKGNDNTIFFQNGIEELRPALSINTKEVMQGKSEEEFREAMLNTLKGFRGKKIYNNSLNGDIEIRTSSIKKYRRFFEDPKKRLIVPYISEILGKARFTPEQSYTPHTETNIKNYWKSDVAVRIDDALFNAHLTVKEDNKGNYFWDAQVKEKAQLAESVTSTGAEGLTSDNSEDSISLSPVNEDVNTILQQTANTPDTADSTYYQNTQGFFDSDLKAIVIGDNFNFGTLPHELSHFWLDKTFEIWKSGKGTDKFFVNFGII
jgi:hypothetical protein